MRRRVKGTTACKSGRRLYERWDHGARRCVPFDDVAKQVEMVEKSCLLSLPLTWRGIHKIQIYVVGQWGMISG
jgi:hypothetical protein